jgi:hypothetical protein
VLTLTLDLTIFSHMTASAHFTDRSATMFNNGIMGGEEKSDT